MHTHTNRSVCVHVCVVAASPDDKDEHSDEGQGWWNIPQYCHPCRGDGWTDAHGEWETGAQQIGYNVNLHMYKQESCDCHVTIM